MNSANIIGNLTTDAVLRNTHSGNDVLNFTVAINEYYRDRTTGQRLQSTSYIRCVLFGPRARAISPYMRKGTRVGVAGKLRSTSWERDGQRHSSIEIIVSEVDYDTRDRAQAAQTQDPQFAQPNDDQYVPTDYEAQAVSAQEQAQVPVNAQSVLPNECVPQDDIYAAEYVQTELYDEDVAF